MALSPRPPYGGPNRVLWAPNLGKPSHGGLSRVVLGSTARLFGPNPLNAKRDTAQANLPIGAFAMPPEMPSRRTICAVINPRIRGMNYYALIWDM